MMPTIVLLADFSAVPDASVNLVHVYILICLLPNASSLILFEKHLKHCDTLVAVLPVPSITATFLN